MLPFNWMLYKSCFFRIFMQINKPSIIHFFCVKQNWMILMLPKLKPEITFHPFAIFFK